MLSQLRIKHYNILQSVYFTCYVGIISSYSTMFIFKICANIANNLSEYIIAHVSKKSAYFWF